MGDSKAQNLQIPRRSATLRSMVEDNLRKAIASGTFKPGQRMIERDLCERIGVGRTSIREALRQLEAEGLVVSYPHKGPVVASFSAEEVRQLYVIRAELEGFCGREFARHGSREDIAKLIRAVDAFDRAAQGDDQEALIETKTHFYDVLAQGAGNIYVTQFLTSLHNRITLLRVSSMRQPGRLPESVREIRLISEAIAAGEPERAEAACKQHIENAARVAIAQALTGQSNDAEE
ncbi:MULTISPECIES: GntR family transcriptional regulator [Roseobacteraceae]|uniref:Transcriptional regulator, GntR family n=2 Tax=Roseobacteraceae TaxID=2854170 RepID=A0A1I6V049_9RHOB|nr:MULTISPECIES: GntR family transcriptional regulator [Roseobacteraceae]MBE9637237.1 GntR family transcriptional regulator [Salipiger mangrovisoli]SDI32474.1 transcriptional regulator, GntR family [Alloyangia pacifica]SFT06996.1 transcriptional regulator, GntR family [Alloyangia pacifica]